jgi:hypothetical protein
MNPEIIHHYSPRHVFTLWSIPAMLNSENHIIPWEYNRPVDRLRVEEIVEYIARKNILDWTIYMIYDSKTKIYKVVDGNHRFHAIKSYLDSLSSSIDKDSDALSGMKITVSIRIDPTFGETTDWFQALNRANPVPELYTEDKRNGEKRLIIESVVKEVQEKWKSHFSACPKPHIPNTNRDRFIEIVDVLYEKYGRVNRMNARDILLAKIEQKNNWVRENLWSVKKIPKKAAEKCEETGCYLFLRKPEWLEE